MYILLCQTKSDDMKRTITILSCLLLLMACTPNGITTVNLRTVFPLGVIRDGVNYYCCQALRLEEHVLPGTVTLPKDTEYILLKYTL